MKKLIASLATLFIASVSNAQSFNLGLGAVRSVGLGFDEIYGLSVMEVSTSHPSLYFRASVEILDAEKIGQDGYGASLDITLTKPVAEKWGILACYRPSFIDQTDYKKSAHQFGAGVALITKKNGRWDLYGMIGQDNYKPRTIGMEFRFGHGHWLRLKAESVQLTIPSTGKKQRGSRVALTIAPRIIWWG